MKRRIISIILTVAMALPMTAFTAIGEINTSSEASSVVESVSESTSEEGKTDDAEAETSGNAEDIISDVEETVRNFPKKMMSYIITGFAPSGVFTGAFNPDDLCVKAKNYYYRHYGYYPPRASWQYDSRTGHFIIHLYEDTYTHTSTYAWYEVDYYGVGKDTITGRAIDLSR